MRWDEHDGSGRGGFSFVGRPIPPSFELRLVAVAPGRERPYDEAEWLGALVVVEHGTIELECLSGNCRSFERGAVLWLAGLPLRLLRNRGHELALMAAVSRRRNLIHRRR